VEQLDDLPQSFTRVYGTEGTTELITVTKMDNGHLLISGEETISESANGADGYISFLLETDELGNQVRYRSYAFYKGEYELQLSTADKLRPGYYGTNEFTVVWSHIQAVKQLKDGSFFCLGWFAFRPVDTSWPDGNEQQGNFYLLLDNHLEPTKWGYFNDSESEGIPNFSINTGSNNIHELNSGEILFSSTHIEYDDNFSIVNRGFSINKFSLQSGTTKVFRYSTGDPNIIWQAAGSALSTDGASLIVNVTRLAPYGAIGGAFASIAQTSLFKIDIASGALINSRIYYTRGLSFNLTQSDNGYVAQVYHPDPGVEIEPNTRNWWGSLLFVDQNLDSLKLVNVTDTNNNLRGLSRIIRTRDGGYVTEFQKNKEYAYSAVLIKTDADGNVLWRHEEGPDTLIADIVEMSDGGIAYILTKDFNGIGRRVHLVKLTADGNL
jgi:hypothetical protein